MGYYTKYSLEIIPNDYDANLELLLESESFCEYSPLISFMCGSRESKWYEHDDDMKKLSSKFPDKLFILSGHGEEDGDIWRKYYKNGKVQRVDAEIVFEEFDEDKLV